MNTLICRHCDMVSPLTKVPKGYVAKCSRCNQTLNKPNSKDANKMFALAITALLISIPAFSFPLFSVHLLGITEKTDVLQGATMMIENAPVVAFVVIFCAVVAPTLLSICIAFSSGCMMFSKRPAALNYILKLTSILVHWSMIEVYLVSFMVALIKISSYSDLYFNSGLCFLIALLIINIGMISGYDNAKNWKYYLNE